VFEAFHVLLPVVFIAVEIFDSAQCTRHPRLVAKYVVTLAHVALVNLMGQIRYNWNLDVRARLNEDTKIERKEQEVTSRTSVLTHTIYTIYHTHINSELSGLSGWDITVIYPRWWGSIVSTM
jgi:hypothetical protein